MVEVDDMVLLSAVAEVSAQLYEEHPAPRLVCKTSRVYLSKS
jgi:hypothetical protein